MDQAAAKKVLQDLIKSDNRLCCDCGNPNPQWASLGFAVFLCLQCAGTHRGFGVHISFVRSVSMDAWQPDQLKRMQIGGNAAFKQFMKSYEPAEQGGYKENNSAYDIYHCWAASQYREKLDAEIAGKSWAPSAPPPPTLPSNDSAAAGLRKSRASARSATGSSLRGDSASPASFGSGRQTPDLGANGPADQKSANESYFANLGAANAARSADLPPSQGGRYAGFGSTPSPAPSQHPSYGMSSAAAPSLAELQENPVAALSKGWSLFSAAVVGASRAVSENVIQPGMEKMRDPNLQANVMGYVSEAQKRAAAVGGAANQWSKNQFGVDVAESVGGAMGAVRDRVGPSPSQQGYGSVGGYDGESTSLYHDDDDDLFSEYKGYDQPQSLSASTAPASSSGMKPAAPAKKDNDWDDEWKDF
ncbi:ArfGap-domain-containing protein [Mycena indigotica]|uniref:ArfGap-domain-containing protein n=1 Tax=Mycena indigotica TaxID=2126181 RepID=A0A8H6SQ55_9AGAR|nr:ArfGap-domain-containing protein [Mycena indigotica]KAF7301945.1 ArfGap-domain-containing protein [Mycena indigotica]